jgi:ribosomal protein S18 acetylase RimI-like enzyme
VQETIRQLKLDMVAQANNLRESWNAFEVRIITSDGVDIGWVQSSTANGALYLGQIFIDTAFQRRGIGAEIIQGLIDRATQAGQPLTLGVVKTNPARNLYERLGFRITHEDDRKFYMRREAEPLAVVSQKVVHLVRTEEAEVGRVAGTGRRCDRLKAPPHFGRTCGFPAIVPIKELP